jgi:hypothetical protein
MTISDNIQKKIDECAAEIEARAIDPNAPGPKTQELHDKAVEAIHAGSETTEWVAYMLLFAATPDDLAKLIPTNGDTDPERRTARAYLVANGMCLFGTVTALNQNVGTRLD